jgi:hypothetical protein
VARPERNWRVISRMFGGEAFAPGGGVAEAWVHGPSEATNVASSSRDRGARARRPGRARARSRRATEWRAASPCEWRSRRLYPYVDGAARKGAPSSGARVVTTARACAAASIVSGRRWRAQGGHDSAAPGSRARGRRRGRGRPCRRTGEDELRPLRQTVKLGAGHGARICGQTSARNQARPSALARCAAAKSRREGGMRRYGRGWLREPGEDDAPWGRSWWSSRMSAAEGQATASGDAEERRFRSGGDGGGLPVRLRARRRVSMRSPGAVNPRNERFAGAAVKRGVSRVVGDRSHGTKRGEELRCEGRSAGVMGRDSSVRGRRSVAGRHGVAQRAVDWRGASSVGNDEATRPMRTAPGSWRRTTRAKTGTRKNTRSRTDSADRSAHMDGEAALVQVVENVEEVRAGTVLPGKRVWRVRTRTVRGRTS